MTVRLPAAADPFGLWDSVVETPVLEGGAVSFDLSGAAGGDSAPGTPVGAIWKVRGPEDLAARAHRVHAVRQGLAAAQARISTVLQAQANPGTQLGEAGSVSFDIGSPPQVRQDSPEGRLLLSLETSDSNLEAVSFGLLDSLPAAPDWQNLQARLDQLMDSVNRQLLNFAWVDTELGGVLLARTTINWGGDMTNVWLHQVNSQQSDLHCRSLALAIESRQNGLQTVASVASIAGSLALAFTTPLGPARLMALAWQFISEVLVPFMKSEGSS